MLHPYIRTIVDILPGLKALGNNRALAPRWVDISQAAATLAVVLCWPTCRLFVSVCPPATNIFFAAFSSLSFFSLAFSYRLEPLVFLDNDLLSFRYFEHSFL